MSPDFKSLLLHTAGVLRTWATIFASKRALARILSTFLCCVVVVIRPFSHLGGTYAFLVLALKELVFSVQDSLAQQLELTILNVLGALTGIGISTLAKFIAAQYPENSATARATCSVFLVLISFFGKCSAFQTIESQYLSFLNFIAGLLKSRLPRLNLSMRICCFVSVWILTVDIGDRSVRCCDACRYSRLLIVPSAFSPLQAISCGLLSRLQSYASSRSSLSCLFCTGA